MHSTSPVPLDEFKIQDANGNNVFEFSKKNQTFQFNNLTMQAEVEDGILIYPLDRYRYNNLPRVTLPSKDLRGRVVHSEEDAYQKFQLFQRAMLYHFRTELRQDGFQVKPKD